MRLVRSVNSSDAARFSMRSTPAVRPSTSRLPALDPNPLPANCDQLLDEAALIDRIKRGDETAAEALIDLMHPVILKCVRSRLPRWSSEEDLVQGVFAKVFAKLHQFSGSVPLEHWVARVAVNTSLSQIAHEAVRPEMRMGDLSEEQELVLENLAEAQADSAEIDYAREVVELLLARLEPDERLIVTLLHIEQRSTREISRLTGLSVSLVKVRAFRTRHKMRRLAQKLR